MSHDTLKPQVPAEPAARHRRQLVRDLPTPPELAREIEAYLKGKSYNRRAREGIADEFRLQYHFGGKVVYVMATERGSMILAVGDDLDSPEIAGLRDSLTREENERTCLRSFPPWGDDTSIL